MEKDIRKISEYIITNYHNEFSLLGRYSDLTWAELDTLVGNDLLYLKEYKNWPDCINEIKVDLFIDFLKEFKFYIQGKGSIWPVNFQYIDYCDTPTGRHLGEEMRKTLLSAMDKG